MDKDRIKLDRMRYVKDNMPSNFAILAIVFDVLYFVLIYKINNEFFYNFLIGVSIIVNLLFMLFGFWSSIEVKNYHGKFGYFMIALGVVQIIRIFIYPVKAHNARVIIQEKAVTVMENPQFIRCVAYLLLSAACLIVGAVIGMSRSKALKAHLATLEAKAA